jgi:hypothetical protein
MLRRDLVARHFVIKLGMENALRLAQRQANLCPAPWTIEAVGDLKNAAVGLAYLPCKGKTDAASSRLGGVEGHE